MLDWDPAFVDKRLGRDIFDHERNFRVNDW